MIGPVSGHETRPRQRPRFYADETDRPAPEVRIPNDPDLGIAHRRPALEGITVLVDDGPHYMAHVERPFAPRIVLVGKDLADRREFVLDDEARAAWNEFNERPPRDVVGLRKLMDRPSPFIDE